MKHFLILAMLGFALVVAPAAAADAPPGEYTWERAVALGLPGVEDFERPPGMAVCPALEPGPFPSVPDDAVIPDNAPSCWMPPEEQGLVFLVLSPGDPGFAPGDLGFGTPETRYGGPETGFGSPVLNAPSPFSALAALGVYLDDSP
jgi:hypothetical protein